MAMPTMYGPYTIPAARIGILLDHLIAVVKNHPVSFTKEDFIPAIGAAPTSNGPADKLRDMIQYGLLRKDALTYTITDLGKSIIEGQVSERPVVIERVIRNIPLWDLLINTVGTKPTPDAFYKAVQQIITDDKNLNNKLSQLWYAFREDIACIRKTPPFSKVSPNLGRKRIHKMVQTIPDSTDYPQPTISSAREVINEKITGILPQKYDPGSNYGVIEYNDHRIEIKDDLSYAFAIQIMKKIRKDLERKTGGLFEDF